MRPGKRDIEFTQGDDYRHTVTFSGVPDVSSWVFAAQVRVTQADTADTPFAISMTNAATGVIVLTLTKAQTVLLPQFCVWDLQANDGTGINTLLAGDVQVFREVTR
jgi:hypothetical protein